MVSYAGLIDTRTQLCYYQIVSKYTRNAKVCLGFRISDGLVQVTQVPVLSGATPYRDKSPGG